MAAQHKAGLPAVPYFIHTNLPDQFVPELSVLKEEWLSSLSSYGGKALCYGGTLNDYMVHRWSQFAEQTGIDGWFGDNIAPLQCDILEHGCGYKLPDGRVQPTFKMFGTREYFLRCRAVFLEQRGDKTKLVMHNTNNQIIPWIGAVDVACDG